MNSIHGYVQQQIVEICNGLGLEVKSEYRGKDWRADVMVHSNDTRYAFEIQTSPQTLKRTRERQEKYKRDGIIGCWLFEKEPAKMMLEMEDLPIFKIESENDNVFVSLKGRKTLALSTFITDFVNGRIKFCHTLNPIPYMEITFLEMACWECGLINHIHYIAPLKSACNTYVHTHEVSWTSDKYSFRPEILKKIQEYAQTDKGRNLNLAVVKERFSRTMDKSYMSFGCSGCDSIFGDFYVHELKIENIEGEMDVDTLKIEVDFDMNLRQEIPHWCHPGEHPFCDESID